MSARQAPRTADNKYLDVSFCSRAYMTIAGHGLAHMPANPVVLGSVSHGGGFNRTDQGYQVSLD